MAVGAIGGDLYPVAGLQAALGGGLCVYPHRIVMHDFGKKFLRLRATLRMHVPFERCQVQLIRLHFGDARDREVFRHAFAAVFGEFSILRCRFDVLVIDGEFT